MGVPSGHNEKRLFLRYPIKLLVEVKSQEGQTAVVTETQDLSQGGMSFYTDWKLPLGHVIDITFLFGQKSFHMKSQVTYVIEDPKIWRFYTGVSFLDHTGTVYVKLAKQFIELIKEDIRDVQAKKYVIYEVPTEGAGGGSFWSRLFGRK